MASDWELLERYAGAQDQAAFGELVGRHVNWVYGAAQRMLGGPGKEEDDVVQAVFLLLAQKAERIPRRGGLAGWLFGATRYCCANVRKADRRRQKHEREAGMQRCEPDTGVAAGEELRTMLDEALGRLGEKERQAILVRYLQGKTAAETGAVLGVSAEAVEKRLERGIGKLRALFGRKGFAVPAAGFVTWLAAESAKAAPAAVAAAAVGVTTGTSAAAVGIAKGAAAMMKVITFVRAGLLTAAAFLVLSAISATWIMAHAAPPPAPASATAPSPATSPAATQPAVWVALLVKSPMRSITDYHTVLATDPAPAPPLYKRVPIPDCELEIRRAKDQARLVRIPRRDYLREVKIGERSRDWNFLDQVDRRRVGSLPDGDYLIALCIGESRISNVAEFQINAAFDPTKEPALRAIPIEPGPGREPRYLGLRGIAPSLNAPAGFDAAFYFPDLVVDGSRIVRPGPQSFIGPGPIPPGQQCESIVDLRPYAPNLALDKPHAIIAGSGKYQSDKVQLALQQDLGRAWDDVTRKTKPPPEPPVMLAGQVIGPDGKPAKGYEVALGNNTPDPPQTETDDQGRYSFVNIPPGAYRLSCHPLQMGSPEVTVDNITIPVKDPLHHDLVMASQCTLAGSVNTPDGKPAAKIDVDLVVQTAPGKAEFRTTTQTDEQGRYELACPLGVVTYLGIKGNLVQVTYYDSKGKLVQGKMPVLKSGRIQADYILINATARPANSPRGP